MTITALDPIPATSEEDLKNWSPGQVAHITPNLLVLRRNIRDAAPDPDLVKSIKALGVLEPITAVRNEHEGIVVRYGHRRTLAAIEAGVEVVPVYLAGDDDLADAAEVDRIIAQRDENTHRQGLTSAEELGVINQLSLFGLSAAQIAKRARIKRDVVDTARKVLDSELAAKATEKYEALTLDQAAAVAEFDDDPDTAKALIVGAIKEPERFPHLLQKARSDRETRARLEALAEEAASNGARMVERAFGESPTRVLSRLLGHTYTDGEGDDAQEVRVGMTREEHAATGCERLVAWTETQWVNVHPDGTPLTDDEQEALDAYYERVEELEATVVDENENGEGVDADDNVVVYPEPPFEGIRRGPVEQLVYGCEDWREAGHEPLRAWDDSRGDGVNQKRSEMTDEEREAAKAARRLVIENNKAWAAAEVVRKEYLGTFAQRKTAPKQSAKFLALALTYDAHLLNGGSDLCAELLGGKNGWDGARRFTAAGNLLAAEGVTDAKALHLAVTQVLCAYEDSLNDASWRRAGSHTAVERYLRFLEHSGYGLSEVEEYAISDETA